MIACGLAVSMVACSGNGNLRGGSGLIEANESIVSAEISGRVLERRFDEGSVLATGDTLAVIDPSRLRLEIVSAEAARRALAAQLDAAGVQVKQASTAEDFARTELERVNRLLNASTATQRQLDQAEYQHDTSVLAREAAQANARMLQAQLVKADADIARLQRSLEDCYPLAPISGTVTEKFIDAGELLSPGKALVRLSQLDTVWVKIYLSTGQFSSVQLGDAATVSTESGGTEMPGTVVWTSSQAEFTPKNVQTEESRADLVYAVKVSIPNPDRTLKVGMPVFVTLEN